MTNVESQLETGETKVNKNDRGRTSLDVVAVEEEAASTEREHPKSTTDSNSYGILQPSADDEGLGEVERAETGWRSRPEWKEVLVICKIALPVVVGYMCGMGNSLISVIAVGHLGELELASSALATMFCAVTGWSVGTGLISAVDTLASQAYGAQNYHRVGIVVQRGIGLLGITFIPVFIIWLATEDILLLFKQDPETSKLAALYVRIQIPGLPAYWGFELVKRYLQTQSIVRPGMIVSIFGLVVNAVVSYVLIYGFGTGFIGAPIAVLLTYWSMFIGLMFVVG